MEDQNMSEKAKATGKSIAAKENMTRFPDGLPCSDKLNEFWK